MLRVLLVSLLSLAGADTLTYHAQPGDAGPILSEFTYSVTFVGPPALINQLMASNAALSVQQLHATRKGHRKISAGDAGASHIDILIENAHVEGLAKDKPFEYDFDQPTPPADLAKDPIRQFAWGFGMAPRRYMLGPKGEFHLTDANGDGQAEQMAVLVDVPVRLSDRAVNAGDQWTSDWTGTPRKKDGATMKYHQSAKLEEMLPGGTRRARISFSTSGKLDVPPEKNTQGEQVTLESKGSVVLDLSTGLVTTADSAGTMTTEIKIGNLKIVHGISAKYQEQ
jgi:hypothetical protein